MFLGRKGIGLGAIALIGIGAYLYLTREKAAGESGEGSILGGLSNIFSPSNAGTEEPLGTTEPLPEPLASPIIEPTRDNPIIPVPQQLPAYQRPPEITTNVFQQSPYQTYNPYQQGYIPPTIAYVPNAFSNYAQQVNAGNNAGYEPSSPYTSIFAQSANQRTIKNHGQTRAQINASRSTAAVSRTGNPYGNAQGVSKNTQRTVASTVNYARSTGRVTSKTTNAFQRPTKTTVPTPTVSRTGTRITSSKGGVSKTQQTSVLDKVRKLRAGQ